MSSEPTPSASSSTPDPALTSEFTAAYKKHLPEILAVEDDELIAMNLDPRAVAFTVLGSLPEIRQHDETIRQLPKYPLASYENLETYAQALYYAHAIYLGAFAPNDEVGKLYLEAIQERDVLLTDIPALVKRGLVPAKRVESFKGMAGFKNVSSDLLGVVEVLDACWPAIEGSTAIKRAELQHAKELAERLVRAASLRAQSPAVVADAQHNRQRAYTLVVRAWDDVRRAVAFIRWRDGDLEKIAPSLWAGRGTRSKTKQATLAKTELPSPAAQAAQAAMPATPVANELPGGSPFLS